MTNRFLARRAATLILPALLLTLVPVPMVWGDVVPVLYAPGGSSDYAEAANSVSLSINGQLTMEAWVNPQGWRDYSGREKHGLKIIYKGLLGSHLDYGMSLEANGYLVFGNTTGAIGILRPVVPLNQWTHVAITVNETTREYRFYINGADQGAWGLWGGGVDLGNSLVPSGNALYVGGFWQRGWGYNNDNFIGRIAEVRIWRVARTAEQIAADWNRKLAGPQAGLAAYWDFVGLSDKSSNGNGLRLNGAAALQTASVPITSAGTIETAIVAPTNGAVFTAPADIAITATAESTGGVSRVDFLSGGTVIGDSATPPFAMLWEDVPAGIHSLKARATNAVGQTGESAAAAVTVRGPFQGSPSDLPGWVEAENYDFGGEGLTWHDMSGANEGGVYRVAEGVDIAAQSSASNGHTVGWTKAGEWMEYTVNVASSGVYTLSARAASVGAGGTFHIEFGGVNVTGPMAAPNTGSWTAYQWVDKTVALTAGLQRMRVVMDAVGVSGHVAAIDGFRAQAPASPPPPSGQEAYNAGRTPWPLPGSVECENFDYGGAAVAYSDTTAANEGGAYRPAERVDIAGQPGKADNGYTVGWTKAGEWLEYTVNIAAAGTYIIEARVAGVGSGGAIRFKVDGTEVTGNIAIPHTGGWDAYQTVRQTGVSLPEGEHVLQVYLVSNGTSGYVAALDSFRVTAEGAAGPLRVECEDFDAGAEGAAYHDTTPANEGGQYRSTGVDIAAQGAANNGYTVGWTKAGEWMNYTVSVPATGNYTLRARVAGVGAGGTFHVTVGGVDRTGLLTVPNTGAWDAYLVVAKMGVSLSAGSNAIRLAMDDTGPTGFVGAFDYLELEAEAGSAALTLSAAETAGPGAQSLGEPLPPQPVAVQVSSGAAPYADGWAVADGNPETMWVGASGAGGWWVALTYDGEQDLNEIRVDWAAHSPTNLMMLGSTDAVDWFEVTDEQMPATAAYLWFVLPDSGSGIPPAISEIDVW